jgi:ketosteroid isomerase-like protein
MSAELTESLLKQWFRRVWDEADATAIEELATPQMVSHGLLETITGATQWRTSFYEPMRQVFDSVKIEVLHEVAGGDRIFAMMEATQIPRSTGKPVKMRGSCLLRLEDGKIAEAWDSWDFLGLLEGMKMMPANSLGMAITGALQPHPQV